MLRNAATASDITKHPTTLNDALTGNMEKTRRSGPLKQVDAA